MAAKTAKINARLEPELKAQTERVLDDLGLSITEAIRLFFKQIVHQRGLPFDVRLPNAETRSALEEARQPDRLTTHPTPDDHFTSLGI